jgi:hypothetical protein
MWEWLCEEFSSQKYPCATLPVLTEPTSTMANRLFLRPRGERKRLL